MEFLLNLPILILIVVVIFGFKSFIVVPQQEVYVVERLGRFHKALTAGTDILIPFIDRVAYRHSLKEVPLDVPSQVCITHRQHSTDCLDSIIYFKLPILNLLHMVPATTSWRLPSLRKQLCALSSAVWSWIKPLKERDEINSIVVAALDEAAGAWGVKVLRYEIKDLVPPQRNSALHAGSKLPPEREKRARIAESEGRKIERINLASGQREAEIQQSEGEAQAAINASNGEKIARINRAQGEAEALRLVAKPTPTPSAKLPRLSAQRAVLKLSSLKVAEQYVAAPSAIWLKKKATR